MYTLQGAQVIDFHNNFIHQNYTLYQGCNYNRGDISQRWKCWQSI